MPDDEATQEETEEEVEETEEEKAPPNKGYAVGGLQRTPQ